MGIDEYLRHNSVSYLPEVRSRPSVARSRLKLSFDVRTAQARVAVVWLIRRGFRESIHIPLNHGYAWPVVSGTDARSCSSAADTANRP